MWNDRVIDCLDVTPKLHPPALVWALQLGHTAVARYLVEQGADISLEKHEALYLAAKAPQHANMFKAMLKTLPREQLGPILNSMLRRHPDIIYFNIYALIECINFGLNPNLTIPIRGSKKQLPLLPFVVATKINLDVIAYLIKFDANRDWFCAETMEMPAAVTYLLTAYNPKLQSDQFLKKHFKQQFIQVAENPKVSDQVPTLQLAILNSLFIAPEVQFDAVQFLRNLETAFNMPLLQPGLMLIANACLGKFGKPLKCLLAHRFLNQHFFGLSSEANACYSLKYTIFQAWSTHQKAAFKTWLHECFHYVVHFAFHKNDGLPFFANDSATQQRYISLSNQVMKHSKLITLKEIDLSYENNSYQHAELPARAVECLFDERLRGKFMTEHADVITYFETVINPVIQRYNQQHSFDCPVAIPPLVANM